ncbi:MAG TPA: hypothetical protein H9673_05275 [Candidatus Adamsella sp.]|nr:hypothetical protein [Candidatus Adamsella sp.]
MNLTAISAIIAIIISFVGLVIQLVAVGIYIGKLEGFKDLVNYKFAEQKDRLDKHNNFITRLYEVERRQGIDEEKIDVANHRIADLENKGV